MRNNVGDELPASLEAKIEFWLNIMPFFYEALPILVVYASHVKNFRIKKAASREPSYDGTASYDESVFETEGLQEDQVRLLLQ